MFLAILMNLVLGSSPKPDSKGWEKVARKFDFNFISNHILKIRQKLEDDPTLEFIKVFMPEIQKRLFGPAAAS